jgi:hypothetical protein
VFRRIEIVTIRLSWQIKLLIRNSHHQALQFLNHLMVHTYFESGKRIAEKKQEEKEEEG